MHDGRVSSSSIIICAMKMIIVIGSDCDSSDISIAVMVCRSCKWLVSFPVEQLGVCSVKTEFYITGLWTDSQILGTAQERYAASSRRI